MRTSPRWLPLAVMTMFFTQKSHVAVFARNSRTTRVLADLKRLFDFLADHNPKFARARMVSVRRAFELLADHRLLGREAEHGRRELILSRGKFGNVAKYSWVPAEDKVLILAVRYQLEARYKDE